MVTLVENFSVADDDDEDLGGENSEGEWSDVSHSGEDDYFYGEDGDTNDADGNDEDDQDDDGDDGDEIHQSTYSMSEY